MIPGLGRSPGGGHGKPLQCSFMENPHGQRNLVHYSPWGHKESDTTERLNTKELNRHFFSKGDTQMANRYMTRCQQNCQGNANQTTVSYLLIPVGMAIVKKEKNKCQRCGEK